MVVSETADEHCTSGFHLCWSDAGSCYFSSWKEYISVCARAVFHHNLCWPWSRLEGLEVCTGSIVSPLCVENLMLLLVLQAFIKELSDGSIAILCLLREVNCSMALTVFTQIILYWLKIVKTLHFFLSAPSLLSEAKVTYFVFEGPLVPVTALCQWLPP